jgi:titin
MWFNSWLRNKTRHAVPARSPRRRARWRPCVERLEDRTVPSTFLVTNNADSGAGSLRQAILDVNARPGHDEIDFAISGDGVQTITPLSPLPALTAPGTVLDGYTQPGASANTLAVGDNANLLIELDGSSAGDGATGLQVTGGGCTVRGLVVNGFGAFGITLASAGQDVVEGNFVGTDPSGLVARGNGFHGAAGTGYGIFIDAPSNTVGGATPAARNMLSANYIGGALVYYSGNVIQGNYAGTDYTGNAALGAQEDGIVVGIGQSGNTIGGDMPGQGNVLAGNQFIGLELYDISLGITNPDPTFVEGNLIGLGADGMTAVPNGSYGIYVALDSRNVHIGGPTAAARNVISDNGGFGIITDARANGLVVQGNYIGTDSTGERARPNTYYGIATYSADVLIGGLTATPGTGPGNVIAGNGSGPFSGGGIAFSGNAPGTGDFVEGNIIGLDAGGTTALNDFQSGGISSGMPYVMIGGTAAGARNVISGNGTGVSIATAGNTGDVVQGNYIGTDISGTQAAANQSGVVIYAGASGSTIGGASPGAGNLISGNVVDGVQLSDTGTSNNVVEGNHIGTDVSGAAALINGIGVLITGGASGNTVGTVTAGAANVIAYSSGAGVVVVGATSTGNAIRGNSIHDNSGIGIDLGGDGVTLNDSAGHVGPNNYQNFPTTYLALAIPSGVAVAGTLNSTPGASFTLDFYDSDVADPSGYGQGQHYLGSLAVTTGQDGNAYFIVSLAGTAPVGSALSITATDAQGNTSEFSLASPVRSGFYGPGGAGAGSHSRTGGSNAGLAALSAGDFAQTGPKLDAQGETIHMDAQALSQVSSTFTTLDVGTFDATAVQSFTLLSGWEQFQAGDMTVAFSAELFDVVDFDAFVNAGIATGRGTDTLTLLPPQP